MGPNDAPLFKLMSTRMGWLSQRQSVLAQNIANADTPDYRPKDLKEESFQRMAKGVVGMPERVPVLKTNQRHLDAGASARLSLNARDQKLPYEESPDGNAVVLEEQTAKAGQTALDHQLVSNLYKKYVGMYRIALGSQGGG